MKKGLPVTRLSILGGGRLEPDRVAAGEEPGEHHLDGALSQQILG